MELLEHQMQRWIRARRRGPTQCSLSVRCIFRLYFDYHHCVSRQWRHLLYCIVETANADRHESVHCQSGSGRHPDDNLLRALLVPLDSGAGLLAFRQYHVSSGKLLAGRIGAGECVHIGGDQHRPVYRDYVAVETEDQ